MSADVSRVAVRVASPTTSVWYVRLFKSLFISSISPLNINTDALLDVVKVSPVVVNIDRLPLLTPSLMYTGLLDAPLTNNPPTAIG